MIVLELVDGAGQGNQMFMYSRAYALARETGQKMIILFNTERARINTRPYVLDKFNIDKKYIKKIVRLDKYNDVVRKIIIRCYRLFYKRIVGFYTFMESRKEQRVFRDVESYDYKNYYLYGNFESYKYFDKYRDEIVKQFSINYKLDDNTKEFIKGIKKCNSVSLHIRMGDFVSIGRDVSIDYYKKQMEKVKHQIENPIFYLATTDNKIIDEFKKYENIRIVDTTGENKDINDWLCLKECKHHIITDSTYSWWAAYLSDSKDKKVFSATLEEYSGFQKHNCDIEYYDYFWKTN